MKWTLFMKPFEFVYTVLLYYTLNVQHLPTTNLRPRSECALTKSYFSKRKTSTKNTIWYEIVTIMYF